METMAEKNKYQAYANATQTVAPTRQIVFIYDGAIRCVQQGKEAINEGQIEKRYHLLIKASGLINGLQGCLDFAKGEEIAKVLYDFYSSINMRLHAIQRNNSLTDCDAIIADLKRMRDVWEDIDRTQAASNQKPAITSSETSVGERSDLSA